MCRVLAVWCFLIICTRINCVRSINAPTFLDEKNEWIKSATGRNSSTYGFIEGYENSADETVRNFLPVKGRQKWLKKEVPFSSEMIFFNISVVGDDEEVTSAQLHLHRRRLVKTHENFHKRFLPSPYRVVLYQIQPELRHKIRDTRTMKLASLPVSHRTKGGWHTLDVTPVIRELLINAQGPVELLFGVQFEAPKKTEKSSGTSVVSIKHFLRSPNIFTPEHPYKSPCYLVIYSEKDPFFEDFEEDEDGDEGVDNGDDEKDFASTITFIPTSSPEDRLKERHFKHKITKGKHEETFKLSDKSVRKYEPAENEVIKTKRKDDGRHQGKNKGNEFRRSKADELALEEKTKLKSLPFLHANEVDDIRQTSRRLTRSSSVHREPENRTKYLAKSQINTSRKVNR